MIGALVVLAFFMGFCFGRAYALLTEPPRKERVRK